MKNISYRRHRFPPEIIQHAVWLYFRFTLSYRDIEDLLAERGIDVSYETIRRWVEKFGNEYAKRLNNRIENSHQPTRRRERKLQRFKSAKSTQRFLATFTAFYNHFKIQRHLISRASMKMFRADVLSCWRLVVSA